MSTPIALSLAHATLLDQPPYELARIAARTGYRMVGLRLIPIDRPGEPRHLLPAGSDAMRDAKRLLADEGIGVLDVEVAMIRDGIDLRTYRPALESAAELGARYVLTNVYVTDRQAAIDGLRTLSEIASPLGLTPVVEFVSFSEVRTLAQAVDLVAAAGRPDLGVLFDMLHFYSMHGRPDDLRQVPAGTLAYVHMDDGPREVPTAIDDLRRIAREGRLFPGEGGADFAGVLSHVPADIPYAVEVTNPARAREMGAEAYARLGLELTTRCLRQHQGR